MIELEHVYRTYLMGGQPLHALNDVSEIIADGEYIAVMGPSIIHDVSYGLLRLHPRIKLRRRFSRKAIMPSVASACWSVMAVFAAISASDCSKVSSVAA